MIQYIHRVKEYGYLGETFVSDDPLNFFKPKFIYFYFGQLTIYLWIVYCDNTERK